jgi:acyl dehydratase
LNPSEDTTFLAVVGIGMDATQLPTIHNITPAIPLPGAVTFQLGFYSFRDLTFATMVRSNSTSSSSADVTKLERLNFFRPARGSTTFKEVNAATREPVTHTHWRPDTCYTSRELKAVSPSQSSKTRGVHTLSPVTVIVIISFFACCETYPSAEETRRG